MHNVAPGGPAYVLNQTASVESSVWLQTEEWIPSLALAHYRVQSVERWNARGKIGRATKFGHRWEGTYRSPERFKLFDRNEVLDERIRAFVEAAMPSWYIAPPGSTQTLPQSNRQRAFVQSFREAVAYRDGCLMPKL